MRFYFFSAFLSSLFLTSVAQALTEQKSSVVRQLTTEGHNRQPIIKGQEGFYFISRSREKHEDPQVYFFDFSKEQARQITHQRGHIIGGNISKHGEYFFSSSTDEEKETPEALKEFLDSHPENLIADGFYHIQFKKADIYKIDQDGENVERISRKAGFDGFPALLPSRDTAIFSRQFKNRIGLVKKSIVQKSRTPASATALLPSTGHDLGVQVSPNEQLFVWYRFSPDFSSSQLMLAGRDMKNPQFLTTNNGIQWSPNWHPSGRSILFSKKDKSSQGFDLFEIEVSTGCQRKISSFAGDEFYPTLDPTGETIYFTATLSGKEQIHKMKYPASTPFCL